jgi:nitrite reductase/ring-hydroxylating ferredoxin subunit
MHNDNSRCGECALATASRRAFLRDLGLMVVGALAVGSTAKPALALADSVTTIDAARRRANQRMYALPTSDSIAIDADSEVIIARWQNRVYAFSLRCPHRGTRLEWLGDERRIFCPKHKARFRTDGSHESGRQSRDLDRYDLRREGGMLVVDLDALRRADREPQAWGAAVLALA